MADLLNFLDRQVGMDQYLLAVTADHGICPLPEVSRSKGLDAKRIDPKVIQKDIEDHLTATFGAPVGPKVGEKKPAWVEAQVLPWVYLNPKVCAAARRTRAEVAAAIAEFLSRRPEFDRAITRAELAATGSPEDRIGALARRSFHADRAGDVFLALKPYYLPSTVLVTGTTHGAPHEYDTHVPLLVIGPGVAPGSKSEPTTPQAAAAIFARWLDLRLPKFAEFPVPESLLR
jgi:hypothetical protein